MANPLRVGVIGLGSLWRGEVLPALAALRRRFRVACVADAVPRRAAREAKRLRCTAAAGPAELFARHAPDAVLLLDAQWHGLWPVELACRHGTPLLCCPPLDLEPERAAALAERVAAAGAPVQPGLLPRRFPATARLRELLAGPLGAPRHVLCQATVSAGGRLPLLDLIDWCGFVFVAEPVAARCAVAAGLRTALIDYGDGRGAQVTACPGAAAALRLRVEAERGAAVVTSPYRLHWQESDARHQFQAGAPGRLGRALLEGFSEVAARRRPPEPGLPEVGRLLAKVAG